MTAATHDILELHDRATRGGALTADEAARLDAWYTEQDAAENVLLSTADTTEDLSRVRGELAVIEELTAAATARLQRISTETEALRAENTRLEVLLRARRT